MAAGAPVSIMRQTPVLLVTEGIMVLCGNLQQATAATNMHSFITTVLFKSLIALAAHPSRSP